MRWRWPGAGRHVLGLTLCALVWWTPAVVLAQPAAAEEGSSEFEAPTRPMAGGAALTQTDDELRDDGWVVQRRQVRQGSVLGGLVALTGGFFWHGAGHYILGDRKTARRLVAVEAASVGVGVAGLVMSSTADAEVSRAMGRTLATAAGSAFVASWVADVVGAFKGTGNGLPPNTGMVEGLSAELAYTILFGDGLDTTNVLVTRLPLVSRTVVFVPSVQLRSNLDYRQLAAYGGWRQPLRANRRLAYVEFGGAVADENIESFGAGRTQLRARALWSWDFGAWAEHLDGLVWRTGVNVAADHFFFASDRSRRFRQENRVWSVPVEFSLSANVNRGVNVMAGYTHGRDLLVGNTSANGGVWSGRLSVVPVDRLGIDLTAEFGEFTRLWAGLRYVLAGRRSRLDESLRVD